MVVFEELDNEEEDRLDEGSLEDLEGEGLWDDPVNDFWNFSLKVEVTVGSWIFIWSKTLFLNT